MSDRKYELLTPAQRSVIGELLNFSKLASGEIHPVFARNHGVSPGTLSSLERAEHRRWTADQLARVGEMMGVNGELIEVLNTILEERRAIEESLGQEMLSAAQPSYTVYRRVFDLQPGGRFYGQGQKAFYVLFSHREEQIPSRLTFTHINESLLHDTTPLFRGVEAQVAFLTYGSAAVTTILPYLRVPQPVKRSQVV